MNIHQIEPRPVWKNFSLLNAIPRPSKKEERVIAFMKAFGEELSLPTIVDEVGNVIIKKPATKGMEDRQTIVLQCHLDMVCQKNNDTDFDFDTQGIQMYVDGDWVKAKGTTLGADNGLGVASMMAVLESTDIPHPAIEALFTIDEETGMTGALGLKGGLLTGSIMLNLDTEEDNEITIGCAGGVDVTGVKKYESTPLSGEFIKIDVKGLQGGHSGGDIHKDFGNSNIILSRLLLEGIDFNLQLAAMDSGGLRNAIPREGHAIVQVENGDAFIKAANKIKEAILLEFANIEKDLSIEISKLEGDFNGLNIDDSRQFILTLQSLHNGVFRMSPDIADLVEASNNVARVEVKDGHVQILNLTRSSVESTKQQLANKLKSAMSLAGMEISFGGDYPGWKPNPSAEIITTMSRIYEEKFNEKPHVMACHAGLECGIIGANYPEMEMVSFGPCIRGAHSPDERASVSSCQKFWSYFVDVLANIPKK